MKNRGKNSVVKPSAVSEGYRTDLCTPSTPAIAALVRGKCKGTPVQHRADEKGAHAGIAPLPCRVAPNLTRQGR